MISFKTIKALLGFLALLLFLGGFAGCSSPEKRLAQSLAEAREAVDSGDVNQGLQILLKLNDDFPDNPEILEEVGFAYAEEPDPFSAAIFLQQAVDLDATRTYLLKAVAENYQSVGNDSAAKMAYLRYLGDFAEDGEAWYAIAELHREDNEVKPAVDAYLKAFAFLGMPPTGDQAIFMGDLFYQLRNIPRAESYYQMALEADELSALPALFGLLQINVEQGNWQVVERIIGRLDEDFPGALDASPLATARMDYLAWKDAKEAFEAEQAANRIAAEALEQSLAEGIAAAEVDPEPEPVEPVELTSDTTTDPAAVDSPAEGNDSVEDPAASGKMALLDGEIPPLMEEPEVIEDPVIELTPDERLVEEARAARLAGDYTEAVRLLWQALGINPSNAAAWFELSQAYLENNEPAASETASLEAMRLSPNNPQYALHHVDVIRESRSPTIVMRELRRAIDRFPDNPEITYEMAKAFEELVDDPRNAIYLYREFLEIAPAHPLVPEVEASLRRLGAQ